MSVDCGGCGAVVTQDRLNMTKAQAVFKQMGGKAVSLIPNVAKAGGLQRQGVKGEVVATLYLDPLTTQYLKSSSFPKG